MHFNIYEFDAQVVHQLADGYVPALKILGVINRVSFGNGYCTLSNRNIEKMAEVSSRQRETAVRKLREANLIEVEARFGENGRRLSNKITRMPITRDQLQSFADKRAMRGLDNEVEMRLDNGDLIPGLHPSIMADDVPDVVVGDESVDPQSSPIPPTPESVRPTSPQRGGTPSPSQRGGVSEESQSEKSPRRSTERPPPRAAQPRSGSSPKKELTNCACTREGRGSAPPPSPRQSRDSGDNPTGNGREGDKGQSEQGHEQSEQGRIETLHRWLLDLASSADCEIRTSDMKSPPTKPGSRRKIEQRIDDLGGIEEAYDFLAWTLQKGIGWLMNFHWYDWDVYTLLCGGAVRHWQIQTGKIEQEQVKTPEVSIQSRQEAEKQRLLKSGEYINEDGETEEDGVWR